jgi:hypothetical protein
MIDPAIATDEAIEQYRAELIRFANLEFAYDHSEATSNGEAIEWLMANQARVEAHFAKHPVELPPAIQALVRHRPARLTSSFIDRLLEGLHATRRGGNSEKNH